VPIDRSGWLALRALGPANSDVQGELLYAHTSPVYVVVAGKPPAPAKTRGISSHGLIVYGTQLRSAIDFRTSSPKTKSMLR